MRRSPVNAFILIFFLTAASLPLVAGELDQWFTIDPRSSAYMPIRADLANLADTLLREGIPESLLIERLDEGSAKRIAPSRLLEALRLDVENLRYLGALYQRRYPLLAADAQAKKESLVIGSLILRSGISRDDIERSLPLSEAGGTVRRSLEALLSVAAVQRRSPLVPAQIPRLTQALVSSSEKEERFPALSSLFLRGRAGALRESEIAELVISVLGRGGGFVQAENEITRRIK